MVRDKKENLRSGNSKTTRKINTIWTIDFLNTSDIGYPDDENYTTIEED